MDWTTAVTALGGAVVGGVFALGGAVWEHERNVRQQQQERRQLAHEAALGWALELQVLVQYLAHDVVRGRHPYDNPYPAPADGVKLGDYYGRVLHAAHDGHLSEAARAAAGVVAATIEQWNATIADEDEEGREEIANMLVAQVQAVLARCSGG